MSKPEEFFMTRAGHVFESQELALESLRTLKGVIRVRVVDPSEAVMEERVKTLFEKIKHGDDAHQAWLKSAIEEHFK